MRMRTLLLAGGAVVLAMLALSGYVWAQVPAGEQVCVHWNVAGECDRYGSRFTGILLLPLVAAGMVGLFALVPRIEPRAGNLAASGRAYGTIVGATMLFVLAVHAVLMLDILGVASVGGVVIPALVGLMFVAIGMSLPRLRSTYLVGIRTPWTLASELSWRKTHRLGGRLFVLLGLLMLVGPFLLPVAAWVPLLIAGVLGLLIGLALYSYLVWRRDPEARGG